MLYTDEGDTAHALQGAERHPDSARSAKLYAALGAAYEQRKDYKSAIDAFRRAIVLDRDNLDAIRGLAENLLNDGQLEAALEQYKVIADSNPEDAQTYVRMAEIYRRQAQYDLALENLKHADTLVPDTMDVPYSMASVYQAQGRYDDAIKLLQDLLKRTEKSETRIQPGRPQQPRHLHRAPRHDLPRTGKLHRRRRYLPQNACPGRRKHPPGISGNHRHLPRSQAVAASHRRRQRSGAEVARRPRHAHGARRATGRHRDTRQIRRRHSLHAQGRPRGSRRLSSVSASSTPAPRAGTTPSTLCPRPSSSRPSPTTKPTFNSSAETSISARKCSTRPKAEFRKSWPSNARLPIRRPPPPLIISAT
jgi:hypothetical protein